ncbi:lipoprotein [Sphaerisporangium melleum]|uniref:Lipoprotein n=1 Tax=Sphaerisporangium melleum TaxID=321316 RepID=A0A917R8B9_9ACTN|nr:DUF305 domain-containing protein [Sphaerisporangium melleum]GGK93927.1 lipoprotein [Sphaerisporangium melleum]GII73363.1 lipoprotein [Sphaerisporangium melleum]
MRVALLIAAGVVALTVTGCSGGPAAQAVATASAPVIAPGRPGETAGTLAPGDLVTPVPSPTANAADVTFMQDMVVHHRQALDMSALAATRAASDQVKRIAARIAGVQGPEINAMIRWLRDQGQRVPDHHAAHHDMPGMATDEQLAELRAASGADFDRLYLRLMTDHHAGAIAMAADEMDKGSHITVQELAEDISVTQTAEIQRLRRIRPGG